MMKKNLLFAVLSVMTFVAYFALSLSCASPKAVEITDNYFYTYETQNLEENYDLELLSEKKSFFKVYRVVSRDDNSVYYTISKNGSSTQTTTSTSGFSATSDDVIGAALLTEEDAIKTVEFLSMLESSYTKKRALDAVINDFTIMRHVNEQIWIEETRYASGGSTGHYETRSVPKITFEIQMKTKNGADGILCSIYGADYVCKIEQVIDLKKSLSKHLPERSAKNNETTIIDATSENVEDSEESAE